MTKPLLLDLFCGAGGAAMGYYRAGFDVIGVDIKPQPHYPFEFEQADALEVLAGLVHADAIHASPPCQGYANLGSGNQPKLIGEVRALLLLAGLPYVIENIEDAKPYMRSPVRLCGSSFGLGVRRHRMFETSFPLLVSPCIPHGDIRAYYGKKGRLVWGGRKPLLRGSEEDAPRDMGIDWMTWEELREAIPPAYTQFIGEQLMEHLPWKSA